MNKRNILGFLASIFFGIAISAPYALADTLGYATPFGWAGSGARINIYDNGPNNPPFNAASDISIVANETTSTSYSSGSMSGSAQSSAYVLKGEIYSPETENFQAGGYFRDELYFATYNNQPAELALTFSVSASGYVYGPSMYNPNTGYASLNLGMNVPIDSIPSDWYRLSNQTLIDAKTVGDFSTSSNVTLRSTDWNPAFLIQSGTYLPFTISLWGTVNNAGLNWGDTVELVGVQAFQNGQALDNSQFTILSNNNEGYFSDFAHSTSVPEPTTMLLLGLGLIGLAGVRRKYRS